MAFLSSLTVNNKENMKAKRPIITTRVRKYTIPLPISHFKKLLEPGPDFNFHHFSVIV